MSKSSGVIHTTSVSRPQLKSYQVKDKVVPNICQVKFTKKEVEDHHRISSISKKTKSVTACNDSSNSRTSNAKLSRPRMWKLLFNSDCTNPSYSLLTLDAQSTRRALSILLLKQKEVQSRQSIPSSKEAKICFTHRLVVSNRVASINGKVYSGDLLMTIQDTHDSFLRSKGTEFLNKHSMPISKKKSIEHQTSTPRTPEQNGVVERRTVLLLSRSSDAIQL
ncbi:retrovirus-related pol polyprotein from transposon TNT 1-94 [Tanacetum coccineum]